MSSSRSDPGEMDGLITFLPVTDLAGSRDFYERVLGLELVVDQTTCLIFRVTDTGYLGICEKAESNDSEGVITTLVADDVDGWSARISDAGWPIELGPEHSATYGIYHVFVMDPSGNRIEIQRFDDASWAQP